MRLSAAFFFSFYSKHTGAGFVIYPLSGQLYRGGRPPPTSSNTEKAASGFPFYFFHIPEARPPGFPVSIIPPSFPRLWRPLSGAAAYSFYKQFFSTYYYI